MLSARTMLELAEHEGIVTVAYKDTVGVLTWGIGVTDASGHKVARYKNNPQSIERCIEVAEWLMRTVYLPDVLEAFDGFTLSEHQLAAALSFHYNTGAIKRATWVHDYRSGRVNRAKQSFMNWRKPPEIYKRRKAERDLFFDGKWTSDGRVLVYDKVTRWRMQPINPRLVDIRQAVKHAIERHEHA